jgi:hypothetical protein
LTFTEGVNNRARRDALDAVGARYRQIHLPWPHPCIVLPRVMDQRCIGSVSDQSTRLETGKQTMKVKTQVKAGGQLSGI